MKTKKTDFFITYHHGDTFLTVPYFPAVIKIIHIAIEMIHAVIKIIHTAVGIVPTPIVKILPGTFFLLYTYHVITLDFENQEVYVWAWRWNPDTGKWTVYDDDGNNRFRLPVKR
jgi:hypothetical protein